MTNKEKAREIVGFVLNPKCANGSNGLGLLNTHNQRNADLNNINKCCEEVAMQAMQWKDEQHKQEKQQMMQEFKLVSSWFRHIEQMAKDRKTANGNIMNMQECLNEISVLAKDSREYLQKAMEKL